MSATGSLFSAVRWRWHRVRGGWRCAVGIHRWKGYHDLGDDVNVSPIPGNKPPHGVNDFRTCSWCGKHQSAGYKPNDDLGWFGRA